MAKDLLRQRVLGDLARSGITPQRAQQLKITPLTPAATKQLTGYDIAAYRLPYFDTTGRATKFSRVRFLDPPSKFSKPDKELKYWQAPGSPVRLYFSPVIAWPAVLQDVDCPLYITEGEKKATRACLDGLPTVGLGGVWSWRSARKGVALIDDFHLIKWQGRSVVIVFDSDVAEKIEVQRALVALARELVKLGATPETLQLPAEPGSKVGLDDYLESQGKAKFAQLPREALLGGLGESLWGLNKELAYIEEPGAVLQLSSGKLFEHGKLINLAYAHRTATIFTDAKPKTVNLAQEWLRWTYRRTHKRLTYAPGAELVTDKNEFNVWPGWGVEPTKGDITPWARLMEFMFRSAPEHLHWFLQWLAYPLQNPGTKLYSSCVFLSINEGMGKSLVGVTLGQVYGANYSLISQTDLHADFNDWAMKKQFVLGDDVTGSDRRTDADLLKYMITRESIRVNEKFQPKYVIPDCINYLFTTNQPDAFFLGNNDRRYFILDIDGAPLEQKFYDEYDRWLWREGGPSFLFHHLLNNVSLAGFNPKGHAPVTEAKQAMIDLSRSDLDTWAHQLRVDPDAVLRLDSKIIRRALWTTAELKLLFDPSGERKTTFIAVSKALRRAGFKPLPVTTTPLGSQKLWAARDQVKWLCASHHERVIEYNRDRVDLKLVKKF